MDVPNRRGEPVNRPPPLAASHRTVDVAFGAAIALLVAMSLLLYQAHRHTRRASEWTRHGLDALNQTEALLRHMVDAETGQRGYLLTGDPSYLEPYDNARAAIPSAIDSLRRITAEDAEQQARVAELDSLIAAKLEELAATIALRQHGGAEAALPMVRSNRGKHTMDEARSLLADIETAERAELSRRLAYREQLSAQVSWLIAATALTAVLALGLALRRLRRETDRAIVAERREHETNSRLAVTLESIGDAVIATDPGGRIVFMNQVAEQLTGWPLTEARGRPLDEIFRIVNEQTREPVESPVVKVLHSGVIVGLANHTVLLRRDGTELPIDDSGAPIRDASEDMMGVVLVFRDVSQRTALERMTVEAEASRAKDQFLAMLSHELRAPLSAIAGWLAVLRRSPDDAEIRRRALEVLDRNVTAQAQLVNDLLDVSRVISGKITLHRVAQDVRPLVRAGLESVRLAAEAKALRLDYREPDAPVLVDVDADRMQQIVGNLLANAIKFSIKGSKIAIGVEANSADCRIVVADAGQGIEPAFLPHVFDRFRQQDPTNSRSHGGLGLGLAVVKLLVEALDGRVRAESPGAGQGATFTVELPVVEGRAVMTIPSLKRSPGADLANISVLLLDDDRDTLEALQLLLESHGASVRTASSVQAAREVFEREPPMVIVSDICLPEEDGYSFMRWVRGRDQGRTPSIAVTGLATTNDRADARAAGFDDYLAKPIATDQLVELVRQLVGQGASRR